MHHVTVKVTQRRCSSGLWPGTGNHSPDLSLSHSTSWDLLCHHVAIAFINLFALLITASQGSRTPRASSITGLARAGWFRAWKLFSALLALVIIWLLHICSWARQWKEESSLLRPQRGACQKDMDRMLTWNHFLCSLSPQIIPCFLFLPEHRLPLEWGNSTFLETSLWVFT